MAHTSQAGSLSAKFSEKLKIAGAKASGGDYKALNVAVIKATTNQFHVVPKEKHVRSLKLAVHPSRPRRDVVHVISELHNRLQDATDWLTALKSLITLHRMMRESESAFLDELVRYSEAQAHTTRGAGGGATGAAAAAPGAAPSRLFAMDNFIDRTTSEGRFDFSEWVRAYGKYLDEQLSLYATLRWYVEQEAPGHESRMRSLGARDLLFQLPRLQRLQRRLLDCVPRGAATHDPVVLFALGLVVKESFKVYKAVSEGVINLADAFFEMEYHDAAKGLELYKESMAASDALSGYYATIEQIDEIKQSMQLPKLSSPPPDFLTSMEAYVAEAPRPVAADGEAPAPAKRGVPLRKGRLLAPSGSGGRTGVPVPGSAGAARDPGMVLPVPSASVDSGKAGSAVSSPTVASQSIEAAAPAAGLLDGEAASSPAAAEAGEAAAEAAAAPPKPAPSPLDLLSGLDFSFDAPAAPAAPAAAPGPANPFANPFADVPAAPAAPAPAPAVGSSNPFGDAPAAAPATAAPAPAAFGSGFDWPAAAAPAPAPAAQPGWHQPQAPQYGVQQPQVQAPQQGFYGAVASDDPFAGFGAPSPAAAPTYGAPPAYGAAPAYGAVPAAPYGQAPRTAAPATGSFWGSPASPSGGMPIPAQPFPGAAAAEMSRAGLQDPFAALTGLPPKSSPGSTGTRPSPPRFY